MALADNLIKRGVLKTPRLIEAFRAVDRKNFVPKEFEDYAYIDEPLAIGEGQTISQPWTVAFMLELLNPESGDNIMEVGYGSGWQTALLAYVGANVYAIERVPELCKFGKENFEEFFNLPLNPLLNKEGRGEVRFYCQDGVPGLPEIAQKIGGFDKIIAAASASPKPGLGHLGLGHLPATWRNQLKIGGKIVAPIGGSIFEFTHTPNCLVCGFIKKNKTAPANTAHKFDATEHPGFVFVPLISDNDSKR
ncbi:MAG: protein-L-isoaspartate O-methyltransferase [Candidatus Giovannonibacteria bacterium]|nr:MAG: protein-L-isoaspartate O-methyltransferase [Candidatus Giovannonibacteria bacterium]